jgi:ABC-type polysaccharide/polyol phosphate export permease
VGAGEQGHEGKSAATKRAVPRLVPGRPAGAIIPFRATPSAAERASYGWLVLQFALKDFKIRYTHSVLGYAWSVLNPLMFFVIYYIVFTMFLRFDIPNYPGFLLVGVALWNFFSEGTANGASALLLRADLLTKTVLPREIVVYSALLSAGLTFVINLIVLMIMLRVTGTPITQTAICFPLLLVDLVLLTLGTSLFLAPLYVRYRDIGYLWNIMLQIGFWLTPIIYLDLMIPERWRWIVWINPVARIIGDSRRALIYGWWPGMRGLVLTTIMSIGVALLGYAVFRRRQAHVVEHF